MRYNALSFSVLKFPGIKNSFKLIFNLNLGKIFKNEINNKSISLKNNNLNVLNDERSKFKKKFKK